MADFLGKIFIIEPIDKANYTAKIVHADDEEDARSSVHAEFNPARRVPPASERGKNYQPPKDDDIYKDKTLSTCKQIIPEIIRSYNSISSNKNPDTVVIEYKGKEYHLRKGDADDI